MSLENIRSECSEYAALLQPHVDGELADEEQRRVSDHLEMCEACRAATSEQMWVRATLRSLEREPAPSRLRAGVLAALDEADQADQADAADPADATAPHEDPAAGVPNDAPIPIESARKGRVRDLLRGAVVMVPAAAVAAGLFFVARGGLEPVQTMPGAGLSAAMGHARAPAEAATGAEPRTVANGAAGLSELDDLQPQLDFPLQVAPSQPEQRVELVGARLDNAGKPGLGARLRYRIAGDQHVIDRQRPIGGPPPSGAKVVFRGQPYTVSHDTGAPTLHFELGGVAHQLTLEGANPSAGSLDVDSPDFAVLLDMAHHLARDTSARPAAGR
ncbi:MAG: anti-sigma factor family protein [Nannocystaceae bacterium]|nr:anti-sigma factor [bacterium]